MHECVHWAFSWDKSDQHWELDSFWKSNGMNVAEVPDLEFWWPESQRKNPGAWLCTPLQKKNDFAHLFRRKKRGFINLQRSWSGIIYIPTWFIALGANTYPQVQHYSAATIYLCCMSCNYPPNACNVAMYNLYTVRSSHYYCQWFDQIGLYGSDCVPTWEAGYLLNSCSTTSKYIETSWISMYMVA